MENVAAPFSSTGPQGHRARMRNRLLASEQALADYEILEMLLFLGIPRRDTKPLAKALMNRFGSLAAALLAKPEALHEAGLPRRAAQALQLVRAAATELARPEPAQRPVLDGWDSVVRHLNLESRVQAAPGWGALLLNNRNQVLHECAWPLDTDPARLTAGLLDQALDRYATAVILFCNLATAAPAVHADQRSLQDAVHRAAAPLGIVLHDLVVIGAGTWISLRQRQPG